MYRFLATNSSAVVGPSERATLRMLAAGTGALALIIFVIGTYVASIRGITHVFSVAPLSSWALVFLIVLGAVARWLPVFHLRILSGFGAALGVCGAAQHVVQSQTEIGFSGGPVWISTASAAAVLAALIAAGLWYSWAVLLVCTAATIVIRWPFTSGIDAWADIAQTLLGGVVVGFICAQVITLSRSLDTVAQETNLAAEREAQKRGQLAARTATAALVHDEILTTLTFAGSTQSTVHTQLAQQANQALTAIDEFTAQHVSKSETELAQLVATVSEQFPSVNILRNPNSQSSFPQDLPPAVVQAMRFAIIQALHNSALHAGHSARCQVQIITHAESLRIVVEDTGIGFEPELVAADRLGLRTSITQRVRDAGGSVRVDSTPGAGTTITFDWASAPPVSYLPPHPARFATAQFAVVAASFVCTQLGLAIYSALLFPAWWVPLMSIAVLFTASEVLRFAPRGAPNGWRTAFTVGASVVVTVLSAWALPISFGAQWAVVGAAFLLTTLAFRDRWISAALGGLLVAVSFTVVALFRGGSSVIIVLVDLRVLVVTLVSAALAVSVVLLQRRTTEQYRQGTRARELAAWNAASVQEIERGGAALRDMLSPLLSRIASGKVLSVSERQECMAFEGQLRDRIRAGSLDREPLRSAEQLTRAREVDVLLLDDRGGEIPPAVVALLPEIATHMLRAREQVVVRLLPQGRNSLVSLVVDGTPIIFSAR